MSRTTAILASAVLMGSAPFLAQAPATPEIVVAAFHAAMDSGDGQAVLAFLMPDAVVFESGGAELSRAEFAEHHLQVDMEFAAGTSRELTDQRSGTSGEVAWVLSRTRTTGQFRGRDVRRVGVETMLLRRTPDGWRIVHIHWSSRNQR